MGWFTRLFSRVAARRPSKMVRPWALSVPLLVILTALPLLRPLRHPLAQQVSAEEQARLATVQAIVEHHRLAIDATDFTKTSRSFETRDHVYSDQAPTMSALLSGAYWAMTRLGMTFATDAPRVTYVLTLLGVTLPVAAAAGLVYRMGRLFELRRPWRALLAASAVFATGLVSYATVLNPHAPAAALVLGSAACLVHVNLIARRRAAALAWSGGAGGCAALAAAIDPSALPFLAGFVVVLLAFRQRRWARVGGVVAYALGAAGPIALHVALTVPVTGDVLQGVRLRAPRATAARVVAAPADEEDDTAWTAFARRVGRLAAAVGGAHGPLSHFPVLVLGVAGVGMIMHRHWPASSKALASVSVGGALWLVVAAAMRRPGGPPDWRDAMFAAPAFVVCGPLLLLWAGAWLRRRHGAAAWATAGVLLAFSAAVSLAGAAAGPLPVGGYGGYSAVQAVAHLLHPPPVPEPPAPQLRETVVAAR